MLYKNFFEELAFKFSDLGNLRPDSVKSRFRLFDNIVSDDFVYNVNPTRYVFYMEFTRALKNPELLKSIIYENKLIKNSRESESQIIDKIVARLNRLYADNTLLKKSGMDYKTKKKELVDKENAKLVKRLNKILDTYDVSDKENAKNTLKTIFAGGANDNTGALNAFENGGTIQPIGMMPETMAPGMIQPIGMMPETMLPGTMPETMATGMIQDMTEAPQQQTTVVKNRTPEKEAYDMISKAVDDIQKRIGNNVGDAEIDALDNYLKELSKLKEDSKKRQEDNKNNKESNTAKYNDDITVVDITTLIAKINKCRSEVIKKMSELENSSREQLETQIEEKKEKIKVEKENYKKHENYSSEKANYVQKKYEDNPNSLLHFFRKQLKETYNNDDDKDIKVSKLKDIIDDIENNEFTSIEQLKISKSDRLVFIGVTFLIRLICLVLIDWALNTNYVVSFTQAYVLYVALYCIFVLIIIVIVNMTYNFPLNKLYNGDHGIFTAIASSMYYFYMIPGNWIWDSARFIIHFTLIIFLTVIAIMIKTNENNDDNILNYDYSERKNIRRALSNFTLLLWFFTSIIAMYML
jgi:hypothetical protein